MHNNMVLSKDLTKAMNVHKGSRRYEYKLDDPRVARAEDFLNRMLSEMEDGYWQHYLYHPHRNPVVDLSVFDPAYTRWMTKKRKKKRRMTTRMNLMSYCKRAW